MLAFAFCERIFQQSLILFPSNTMATKSVPNALRSAFAATRPRSGSVRTLTRSIRQRSIHQSAKIPAITSSQARHRPILQPHHQPLSLPSSSISLGTRTIFIQTQSTPNVDVKSFTSGDATSSLTCTGFEVPPQPSSST